MLDFATIKIEGIYTEEELVKELNKVQRKITIPCAVLDPIGGLYNFTIAAKKQKDFIHAKYQLEDALWGNGRYKAELEWNWLTGLITLFLSSPIIEAEWEDEAVEEYEDFEEK